MFSVPARALRAAAIAIPALLATSVALPANAQVSIRIGYNSFHDRLSPYGTWINDRRWGRVWHPTRVSRNFRPYYDGRWVNTREYGWLWVSNERFGDITYHYGRWVSDPRRGWLWVPGYVWAPSWVVWRSGGGNIAWFPMPPGDNYYGEGAYRGSFQNRYGYNDWYGAGFDDNRFLSLWIVVGQDHFADRNYRSYVTPQRDFGGFTNQTRDTTNYTTVNNYIVNRSIDSALPAANPRFAPVAARSVIGNSALVTPTTVGRQVDQRERQQQPAIAPTQISAPQQAPVAAAPQQAPLAPAQPRSNRNQPATVQTQAAPAPQQAPLAAAPQPAPAAPVETRGNRNRNQPATVQTQSAPAPLQAPAVAAPQPAPAETRGNRNRSEPATVQTQSAPAPLQAPAVAAPQPAPAAPAEPRGNRGRGNDLPAPQQPAAAAPQPAPAAAAPAATPPTAAPAEGRGARGNRPTDPKADDKNKDDNAAGNPRRGGN